MEKRFFTPFGTIDIIFRNVLDMKKKKPHIEIEVGGDTEYWASCDSGVTEFRAALLHFVWGIIAKTPLEKTPRMDPGEVHLYIKGTKIDMMRPCGDIVLDKGGTATRQDPSDYND